MMMIKFFSPSERGKKGESARVGGFCVSNTNHQHERLSTSLFSFDSLLLSHVLSSLYNNRGLSYKMKKVIILFKDRVSTVHDQQEERCPVVLAPSQIVSFSFINAWWWVLSSPFIPLRSLFTSRGNFLPSLLSYHHHRHCIDGRRRENWERRWSSYLLKFIDDRINNNITMRYHIRNMEWTVIPVLI